MSKTTRAPTTDPDLTWQEALACEELEETLCNLLGVVEDVQAVADRLQRFHPVRRLRKLLRHVADGLHAADKTGFWKDLDALLVRAGATHARATGEGYYDDIPF